VPSVGLSGLHRPTRTDVVLIGPQRAGKSTIGGLLAARQGVPQVSLDKLRFGYYRELGYDEVAAEEARRRDGFLALTRLWKPFEIHAVERVLADHHQCVFDFGAGHSVYEDAQQVERLTRALAPFRHVVLLLPSPDPGTSVRVVRERIGAWVPDGTPFFDFEDYYVRHPCNHTLATLTVYTEGQTPEQTCAEIIHHFRLDADSARG
jgi:hypothetical protein